jgi:hypothetical protein
MTEVGVVEMTEVGVVEMTGSVPSTSIDFLQRMLSTINSYFGQMTYANTYRLRKHTYHKELGPLKRFFLSAKDRYSHLTIRKT